MGQAEREDGPAVGSAAGAVPAPAAADQDTPPGGFTPIQPTEGATAAELAAAREEARSGGTVASPVTQSPPAVEAPVPAADAPAAESPAQARATAAQQGSRTPEEIERDIEQTREELGETVAALAEKTDVKARAQDKVAEVKQTVLGKKEELTAKAVEKKDELASKAAEKKDELGSNGQGGGGPSSFDPAQVAGTAKETFENNPPAMAGAAFAGGFLLGLLIGKRRAR